MGKSLRDCPNGVLRKSITIVEMKPARCCVVRPGVSWLPKHPSGESPLATTTARGGCNSQEIETISIGKTTDFFKYLGSGLDPTLTDERDVDNRIKSAAAAFGALRKPIFETKHVELQTKKAVYLTLVVSILLYGCWNEEHQ